LMFVKGLISVVGYVVSHYFSVSLFQ
jgi:hypothetical protein